MSSDKSESIKQMADKHGLIEEDVDNLLHLWNTTTDFNKIRQQFIYVLYCCPPREQEGFVIDLLKYIHESNKWNIKKVNVEIELNVQL